MKAILKWSQNLIIAQGKDPMGFLLGRIRKAFSGINNKKISTYLKNYNYFAITLDQNNKFVYHSFSMIKSVY